MVGSVPAVAADREEGNDMIELNPENVRFIIQKAREFQIDEDTADVESPPDLEDVEALEAHEAELDEDLSEDELMAVIEDLEPDQQMSLVALMWLGRGDYDIDEWSAALEDAREAWNERTARYLIGTPQLAEYLEEGLALHGYDVD
jgi:hypothetical protein